MEKYKKPIMKIVELEKVDVLTASLSLYCADCNMTFTSQEDLDEHECQG